MENEEESLAWLALKLIPGLGNRSIFKLIERFGSATAVLEADERELLSVPGIRRRDWGPSDSKAGVRSAETEWKRMDREGIRLLCYKCTDYPDNLRSIPDPPAVLFVRGSIEPRDLVSVAIVGSRAASLSGIAFTEQLGGDLVRDGVTIVSGLALGIDSAAHRGALKGNGRTLAVLGCGLDVEYPRTNKSLRNQICESGACITEFPLGTPPAPGHFPLRNRIISGLALGVVVVEAADRSGSLITARLALEQGREVFAVPGMARSHRSTGPHRLLRQGAKLVESAEDILEEIRPLIRPTWREGSACGREQSHERVLNKEESFLITMLDPNPKHIDEIVRSVGWTVSRVMAVLLGLELKGIVQQLPGKHFTCLQRGC